MECEPRQFEELPELVQSKLRQGALFNSPDFVNLWAEESGKPLYWIITDRNEIAMVAASVSFGRGPLVRLQAMPDGLYCRPLLIIASTDKLSDYYNLLWSTITNSGYARVHLVDFENSLTNIENAEILSCETSIAEISSADWLPPDKKLQSEIRKAERENIKSKKMTTQSQLDSFFGLMELTERRHGRKPKYSREFFSALFDLSQSDSRVDWTIVMVEGKAAASHINLIDKDLLLNWQVYFDKEFSWLKPNQYLLAQAARRAYTYGVRKLCLGATPEDAEGVQAYKEKWGGQPHCYQTLVYHRKGLGWIK